MRTRRDRDRRGQGKRHASTRHVHLSGPTSVCPLGSLSAIWDSRDIGTPTFTLGQSLGFLSTAETLLRWVVFGVRGTLLWPVDRRGTASCLPGGGCETWKLSLGVIPTPPVPLTHLRHPHLTPNFTQTLHHGSALPASGWPCHSNDTGGSLSCHRPLQEAPRMFADCILTFLA